MKKIYFFFILLISFTLVGCSNKPTNLSVHSLYTDEIYSFDFESSDKRAGESYIGNIEFKSLLDLKTLAERANKLNYSSVEMLDNCVIIDIKEDTFYLYKTNYGYFITTNVCYINNICSIIPTHLITNLSFFDLNEAYSFEIGDILQLKSSVDDFIDYYESFENTTVTKRENTLEINMPLNDYNEKLDNVTLTFSYDNDKITIKEIKEN